MTSSLTAHISFYFRPDRLENLRRVVSCIASYSGFERKDIWVHTDQWFEGLPPNATVVVHDLAGLHRKQLTWLHRPLLKSQVDEYDAYMYLEDDILVPQAAIDYWLAFEPSLSSVGLDLGFLRIETDDRGNDYVVDFHAGESVFETETVDGIDYARLRHNYRAFWIYTRDQLREFAVRSDFSAMPASLRRIKENAARGMQTEETTTLIPLVNRQLDPRCRVHHLTNDFWDDPDTLHAKVTYDELLDIEDPMPREWHCTLFDSAKVP